VTISNVFAFDNREPSRTSSSGRRLPRPGGLTDKQVGYVMQTRQREQSGSEFLSLEQHRVVAISVANAHARGLQGLEPGRADASEVELVGRFFDGIERFSPTLVSWNGSGFDLPVLHYGPCGTRCRRRATGRWVTRTSRSAGTTTSAASTGATST